MAAPVMGGWRWASEPGGLLKEWETKEFQESRFFQKIWQRKKSEDCNSSQGLVLRVSSSY